MRALLVLLIVAACGKSGKSDGSQGSAAKPVADQSAETDQWIAKLDDAKDWELALTELERIKDPRSIPALGKAWLEQGRPVRTLDVMIHIARTKTQWDLAMPFLMRAVSEVDAANPRSVDSAEKAADAMGEAKRSAAAEVLGELAMRPTNKRLIVPQISAIRALGELKAHAVATQALIKIASATPPPHPRTATDRYVKPHMEEAYALYLSRIGAAVNSLAKLGDPSATEPLVLLMYQTPELFTQIRRALVAMGPKAKTQLVDVLRGKHEMVNQLVATNKLDQYCGERGDQPCLPVSTVPYYAAAVLGDFQDAAVVPELLEVLKQTPAPPYYVDESPSPSTQHSAAFDALAKIGAPAAAPSLRAIWKDAKADIPARSQAINAYAFTARNGEDADALVNIALDNNADDTLRTEAAVAASRLSANLDDAHAFNGLAKKYTDASADKEKEAEKHKKTSAAADAELDKSKAKLDALKADLIAMTKDPTKSASDIREGTRAVRDAEDAYKAVKRRHRDLISPYKQARAAADAYTGYARMFQTHIARIEIANSCKDDVDCYAKTLKMTTSDVVQRNSKYIADVGSWSKSEQDGLREAVIDRAMTELGKQGTKAGAHVNALLDAAADENRNIRMAVLRALPKIAPAPCASCAAKLDAVVQAGANKTSLADLRVETEVVRNYFASAK